MSPGSTTSSTRSFEMTVSTSPTGSRGGRPRSYGLPSHPIAEERPLRDGLVEETPLRADVSRKLLR